VTRAIYVGPWRIDLTLRADVDTPVRGASLARAIARAAEAAGAPSPASVGLILTDDAELAALNAAHLDKTGPTDVLSFPLLPPEAYPPHANDPGAHPSHAVAPHAVARNSVPSFVLPPNRRTHLGDIAVSVERASAQAREGRGGQTGDVHWSAADELSLLVTHGALHLCGWDHADPTEESDMRALERHLLARP
jgi:probable rRNA maturation factor